MAPAGPQVGRGCRMRAEARDESARRRLAAVAGHSGDAATARALLADASPAVRATALGALARLCALTEGDVVGAMADPSPIVRRRACEVAVPFPGVDLATSLGDDDSSVVDVAAWALGERGEQAAAAVDELGHVATDHPDPLCREAAVAALGAIGDDRGLPAVLAALDQGGNVRLRAVIALAAFSGPDVDAALERARSDRNWQVRQAAEELSG